MATATMAPETITIPAMDIQSIEIVLIGDSPLICHKWSEKAKKGMLDKQMKKATGGKVAKNPEEDYNESLYRLPDGRCGFPTIAFKDAAVDACSHVAGITKVLTRGVFHINGELLPIEGIPSMREDMVRIGMGTADIRYRGEFKQWKVRVPVRYNAAVLSAEQIVNLFNTAGFAIGVGEWRPQKDGSYGMFHVAVGGEE